MKGPDAKPVRLPLRTEHFCRGHAMGVDDLILRGIQHRIGDVARPAGEDPGHEHAEGVVGHGFADALAAVVEYLPESQAGIGGQQARTESTQTIHCDRVGPIFLEQFWSRYFSFSLF